MKNYWWCAFLFRILLPFLIVIAMGIRPTFTSFIYMLMGLYIPFFSVPTLRSMAGSTGAYMKLLLITCILICLIVFSSYVTLFFPNDEQDAIKPCTSIEIWLRTVGIISFDDLPIRSAIIWCLPGKYLVVFIFCVTAVIRPSVIGVIYYLVFLVVMTYWACHQSLGQAYARILICLTPIVSLHLAILCLYQMQYFQDNEDISPESVYGRLFQLTRLQTYKDCQDPRIFKVHKHPHSTHLLPYFLYLLHHLCVLVARELLEAKEKIDYEEAYGEDDILLADRIKQMIEQGIQFIIKISYLVANFIMMFWAIVYVGWKTLALLMYANLIWLIPGRRKIMLATSPFLVIWMWFLLGTSYAYSLDIPVPSSFGLIRFYIGPVTETEYKWFHLLIKSLFSVIIFVTMRQFFQERALAKEEKRLADAVEVSETDAVTDLTVDQPKSKTWQKIESIIKKWFALCWIWVVIITMIWMEFMSTSNQFRITFVGLAIFFVMTFQLCPFNCWKKFLLIYWWIVITYAMFNLFVLYMYQLKSTQVLLHTYMFSEERFKKIGFYSAPDTKSRISLLANPLFFQMAIVIQQHYLQKDFNHLTSPVTSEELDSKEKELEEIDPTWKKIITLVTEVKNMCFFILEIHLVKIILIIGWLLCCFDLCALFVPFVLLLSASCIFGRVFTRCTIQLASIFVQILILARLIYMDQYENHDLWNYVGYYERNGEPYNVTLNTADWLGFHPSKNGLEYSDFSVVRWSFLFVFVVTLDRVVQIRQKNYRESRNLPTVRQRVLFPEINYVNCHDSVQNMLKFWANYGFFKLGLELTAVVCCCIVMQRMDLVAIFISLSLLMTFALSRKWIERILIPYMILFAVMVPLQYVSTVGYWPTYWEKSKTRYWNENDLRLRIQQFCHLPNMAHPPMKEKIIYDFFLLMCLSRNWRVFRVVRQFIGQDFGAGNNNNVLHLVDNENVENPVPDFVTYTRNHLDLYKRVFFFNWFYLSILATFLAGTIRPTIYSFVYILAAFIFLWDGSNMFLRAPESILLRWNLLIFYNVLIMVFRTSSQVFGCILIYEWRNINCKIYTMLTVVCVDKFDTTNDIPNIREEHTCQAQGDSLGLEWDCACFFFLIIQQRIFKSFHFLHVINDAKAQTILSNQGAKLIEEQRRKQRQTVDDQDTFIRTNIKRKLEVFKAQRIKIQGDVYLKRKKNHKHMLRSGDYYLFDDVEKSLDIPLLPPKVEYIDTDYDRYDPMKFTEYLILFFESGISNVLKERALRKHQKQAVLDGKKPEDLSKVLAIRDSKPGPSRDANIPDETETSTLAQTMNNFLFVWGLIESMIVSLTARFNRSSRDFRLILDEIHKNKKILKEKTKYTSQGTRIGSQKIWHPDQLYNDVFNSVKDIKNEETEITYSIFGKLLKSIWFWGLSHSKWLCYLLIIMNQVIRANFISLPLPLMAFCWGAVTIPNPSKMFWVVTIAYTLVMLLIKNFFLLKVADWNEHTFPENPFFPPRVIGIERYINLLTNLILLFTFFFHRLILQWLGLWESLVYRTATLIQDGDYNFRDGKFIPLNKNEAPNRNTMDIKTTGVSVGDYFPRSIPHGASKYAEQFRLFTQQLISPSSTQIPVDVYTPMVICDVINLGLIVFFYKYFESIESDEMGFVQYIVDNRVPVMYIGAVIAYSVLIVIDRWIYQRKNRFAKLVYLYFQVISIHIWFFVFYPMITKRTFVKTFVVQLFYALKCFYFLLSAHQLKNGYPQLISRHFLAHGTTLVNWFAFKLYKMIPYVFEMRSLLDWTFTDTSLNVSEWFKMEEINKEIFDQKCQQDFEELLVEAAGFRQNRTRKYIMGGLLFFLLFLTLIFPLFIFSLGGSVGVTTHPAKLNLELYMGTAEPIFQSYALQKDLIELSESNYRNLTRTFNNIPESEGLFGVFAPEDVVAVTWSSHSLSSWLISPGSLNQLTEELKSNKPFSFRLLIRYSHVGSGKEINDKTYGETTAIPPWPHPARQTLLNMLQNDTKEVMWLPLLLPKFLMITKEAKPKALSIMEEPYSAKSGFNITEHIDTVGYIDDDDDMERTPKRLRNILLTLRKQNNQMWWQIREDCDDDDDNYVYYLKDLVHNSCEHLVIYTFNEKVFSETIHLVTGSGILGLYFIYFMVVYGCIRSILIDASEIWIEDLPNSDRVYRKCRELYVARDMQNFELEEELFSELIFIMRSREILIKLTRYFDDPYNPTFIRPGTRLR